MKNLKEIEKNISRKIVKTLWLICLLTTFVSLIIFLSPQTKSSINMFYSAFTVQLLGVSLISMLHRFNIKTGYIKYYVNGILIVMITLLAAIFKNPEVFGLYYLLMPINLSYSDRRLHYISSFIQVALYVFASYYEPFLLPVPTPEDSVISLMASRITIFFGVILLTDILHTYTSQLTIQVIDKEKQILSTALSDSVSALMQALDAKDIYTKGHSKRVSKYAKLIAKEFGTLQVSIEIFHTAGLLHDIGKIGIPDNLLGKKEPLTNEEFAEIKNHPISSARILENAQSLKDIIPTVLYHHERFDGKGYPEGLEGENIPLEARILSVADAFDAMTSQRPYRSALPLDYAYNEIVNNSGKQFCPKVVNEFKKVYPEIIKAFYTYKEKDVIENNLTNNFG